MTENKRKRPNEQYGTYQSGEIQGGQSQLAAMVQQPFIPLITTEDQVFEAELGQVIDPDNNSNSNMVYLIFQSDQNALQMSEVPAVILVPKQDDDEETSNECVVRYEETGSPQSNNEHKDGGNVILIKDVRSLKTEEGIECKLEPETDPLSTQQDGFTMLHQQMRSDGLCVMENDNVEQLRTIETRSNGRTQFKCDYRGCSALFNSFHQRKLHLDTHMFPASTEFKCNICNMIFETPADRNKHVEGHVVPNTYKCKTCLKTFPYYTSLMMHAGEGKCIPICGYCGVQFVNNKDLDKHVKSSMKCPCRTQICDKQTYAVHITLCPAYKLKHKNKNKTIGKRLQSNEIIILD